MTLRQSLHLVNSVFVQKKTDAEGGRIAHFDRGMLHRVAPLVDQIVTSFDTERGAFKARVTRVFPHTC